MSGIKTSVKLGRIAVSYTHLNSVIVVEHDKDMMLAADYVIDMGPKAGRLGGEVVFAGKMCIRDSSYIMWGV